MIEFINVSHFFKNKQILNNFSLNIKSNKVTSLLGPSGSGKTTILRLASGLENIQSGEILIDNKTNNFMKLKNQNIKNYISYVFQDGALFPHLTIKENIFYSLSVDDTNLKNKIFDMIREFNINPIVNMYPHQASGGQKQLISLIRGLASNPKIIFLDEPFSNLDTRLRDKVRDVVLHILKDFNITSIIVTHDADEAMFMSDYIAILNNGNIQQFGTPLDLYTRPKNKFVAEFFGEINVLEGLKKNNKLLTPLGYFPLKKSFTKANYFLIVRSEGIKLLSLKEKENMMFNKNDINLVKSPNKGKIIESKFLGGSTIVHLALKGMKNYEHIHVRIPGINYFENGQVVNMYTDMNYSYIFEN